MRPKLSLVMPLAWIAIAVGLWQGYGYAQRGGSGTTPVPPPGTVCGIVVTSTSPAGLACSDCNVYIYATTGQQYCCTNSVRTACGSAAAGAGTLTSAALSMPAEFSVSGSPITTSGTFVVTEATESANTVYAGPTTGISAAPGFRAVVDADIPDTITVNRTESRALSVDAPASSEDITIFQAPVALTITGINCVLTSSGTVPFTIRYANDRSAAGTQANSGGTSCTSLSTGTAATLTSTAVSAGNWVWLETGTVSGSPLNATFSIKYTIP